MASLLEELRKALREEEQTVALATGRGQRGTEPVVVAKHIGIADGLRRALDIMDETAKRVAKESDA